MNGEKSLANTLKALPDLLRMEQTYGLLATIIKQWGVRNSIFILLNTIQRTGLIESLTSLLGFRLDKLAPNLFISMWDAFGDREAIISGNKRITYREMKNRVLRAANGLKDLEIKPRDAIAELLYNQSEYFELFFACSLIGSPMPFLNWHMKKEELIEAINRASPKVLVLDEEGVKTITSIKDDLKTVKHFIVVGENAPESMLLWEDLISRSSDEMPEMKFMLALNPYTAGTTGVPKNVNYFDAFSYALSEVAEAPRVPFGEYLKLLVLELSFIYWFKGTQIEDEITHNMRTLIATPLYHAAVIVGWAPLLLLGGTAVLMRRFEPEEFLRLIEKERINWSFVAPTLLQRILALPDEVKRKYNLSSMHSLICAAAPCPPEVKRGINDLFIQQGCEEEPFMEYYGSAETAIITVLLPKDYIEKPKRIESVGKPRCGFARIYDEEKGEWCPPNKVGKVLSRTAPTVSLRYTGTLEKIKDAFYMIDGEEWFDDGLLGYMDEDDFLYLTGRAKEMIISGGVNILPNEIENIIIKNPKVLDVGVIRIPDKDLGEVPAAIVQLKEDEKATGEEIIEYCKKEGLYGYKIPKMVEFVEELPRHIDGKLMKRDLERKYWEDKGIKRRG